MHCKISIVVPCYNQAEFLDECLESVLGQTFQDWECIIVNDGSTDNTREIANNWSEKDNRFKYFYQENSGLSTTRNFGIENAVGEFILPLDADDKISKDYCSLAMVEFEKDVDLKVVYCRVEKFGIENGEWKLDKYSLKLLAQKNIIFCSAIYRKIDWQNVSGYDQKMVHGLEDWEFWISILKNGGKVKQLGSIGFFYRIKEVSMVKDLNDKKRKEIFNYLSLKHTDFYINELGSFIELERKLKIAESQSFKNLKSPKIAIDYFCKTFFRFTIFGTLNKN